MANTEVKRVYYWDNVKTMLIFLVILGHLLIPLFLGTAGKAINALYYFIYLFHMPAFVFCTGLFAKKINGKQLTNKLIGLIIVYLLFVILLWVIQRFVNHVDGYPMLLSPLSAPWYLLAMVNWTILVQLFSELKAKTALPLAIIIGLYIGIEPEVGSFLALSRAIVFFPFFLAGYYCDGKRTPSIRKTFRIISAIVLVGIGIVLFVNTNDFFERYFPIVYGTRPYQVLGYSVMEGVTVRLIWYLLAALMMLCVFCVIPTKKTVVTYIGSRTLGIFVVHRLITEAIKVTGIYDFCKDLSGLENGILFFCLAICILLICSVKPINSFFNNLLKREYI